MTALSRHILLVEDEPGLRRLLQLTLADPDFRMSETPSGAEALALARSDPPTLMFLDIHLVPPAPNGLEVCEALKADPATAGITIAILTSSILPEDRATALAAGADAYFTKPFSPLMLLHFVEQTFRLDHSPCPPEPHRGGEPASWQWSLITVAPVRDTGPNRLAYLTRQPEGWYIRLTRAATPADPDVAGPGAGPFSTARAAIAQARTWGKDAGPPLPTSEYCPICRSVLGPEAICLYCTGALSSALRAPIGV